MEDLGAVEKAIIYKVKALKENSNEPTKKLIIKAINELNLKKQVGYVCVSFGMTVAEFVDELVEKV